MSAGSSEGWGRARICPTLASTWNSGPRYPLIVRAFAGDSTMTSFCVRDTGPSFWWRRQPGGVGTECYVQPDTSGVRVQEPVEDKVADGGDHLAGHFTFTHIEERCQGTNDLVEGEFAVAGTHRCSDHRTCLSAAPKPTPLPQQENFGVGRAGAKVAFLGDVGGHDEAGGGQFVVGARTQPCLPVEHGRDVFAQGLAPRLGEPVEWG